MAATRRAWPRWAVLGLLLQRLVVAQPQQLLYTFEGAFNIFTEFLDTTLSSLSQTAGLTDVCPFRDNVAQSVKSILPQYIRGQDEGLDIIVNAVAAWEFGKKAGKSGALVLALTGSTGIGKSETAFRLAESVFLRSTRVGQSRRFIPNGLLVIRGEDYSDISEAGALGISEVYTRIRARITNHLQKCEGRAVVVFDEVQKIMPGALDVIIPALDDGGSITHTDSVSRKTTTLSTSQVIFVIISDIGAEKMTRLLLKYQKRSAIPINVLRHEVKQTLDEQWHRLQFGKAVNEVVPFLPMEQEHIQDVLSLKVYMLAVENKFVYWLDLVVDPEVVQHLSSPSFIKYVNQTVKAKVSANNATATTTSKVFAKYGARALETGGPLQDLKSLFFRYMRPWRPTQVLHVGLADKKDVRVPAKKSATPDVVVGVSIDGESHSSSATTSKAEGSSNTLFYLQWCKFHESMTRGAQPNAPMRIENHAAFGSLCETICHCETVPDGCKCLSQG